MAGNLLLHIRQLALHLLPAVYFQPWKIALVSGVLSRDVMKYEQ